MKKFLALALALCMIFALCACGQKAAPAEEAAPAAEEAAPAEAAAPAAAEMKKIAIVIVSGDHGFTGESVKHAEMEAEALAEKYAGQLEVVVKSQGEASDQISEIENILAMGDVDAIMLWPTEGEALRSAAQSVVDAGIPLIVYDRLISDPVIDGVNAQIMGDNFFIGGEMGKYLNDFYADYEDVQYLRFVGDASTVTSQRSGGMDEVLDAKFEQVNETFVTDWSSEKAQEQFENWLAGKSDEEIEALDLIVTHDDEIVNGLMNALDAYTGSADLSGIKLITSVGGIDATCQKFEDTKLPVQFATWFFAPSFIREAVDYTAELALGEEFSGTAVYDEATDCYLIPSFSISNAGNAKYDFDQYRASEEHAVRYSIGDF